MKTLLALILFSFCELAQASSITQQIRVNAVIHNEAGEQVGVVRIRSPRWFQHGVQYDCITLDNGKLAIMATDVFNARNCNCVWCFGDDWEG